MGYAEEVAALRQLAAQRELRDKISLAESWAADIHESEKRALEYAAEGDQQNALIAAQDANASQAELDRVLAELPPQQQGLSESKQRFVQKHRSFIEKHGQKAFQALAAAHDYATRPRTDSNNPNHTGMGLREDSPEYDAALENLLEMYGKDVGLRFEPEGDLTPDSAAAISGVSGREWTAQAEKMVADGHNSGALYGRMWNRNTG